MQQGTDLLTQLAQIRERQGKEPLPNPGFIQGFGENDPPSPPPPVMVPGGLEDTDVPEPTGATHFISKVTPGRPTGVGPISEDEMIVPQFKLVVMDAAAQYLGHATMLSEEDQNLIRQVIVKSVKRDLDAAVAPGSPTEPLGASPVAKRGRGRPRKHPVAE